MATFAQYFKVCKEEAEAAESTVSENPETDTESEAEIREGLATATNELNTTMNESDKTEEVIEDTADQINAQKQALEKPEEVTPAQVVLAAESFRGNLRLLGIEDSYIKSLSCVNSEAITASPAQVLSLITVDMEGFLDTAKKVGKTILEKIISLIKIIKDFFKKLLPVLTTKIKRTQNAVKGVISKFKSHKIGYSKEAAYQLSKNFSGIFAYIKKVCPNFKNNITQSFVQYTSNFKTQYSKARDYLDNTARILEQGEEKHEEKVMHGMSLTHETSNFFNPRERIFEVTKSSYTEFTKGPYCVWQGKVEIIYETNVVYDSLNESEIDGILALNDDLEGFTVYLVNSDSDIVYIKDSISTLDKVADFASEELRNIDMDKAYGPESSHSYERSKHIEYYFRKHSAEFSIMLLKAHMKTIDAYADLFRELCRHITEKPASTALKGLRYNRFGKLGPNYV